MGISWESFWKMNPRIIKLHIKGYQEKEENEIKKANVISHLLGLYFQESIAATVGNMFSKKGSIPHKYPEKPYELNEHKEMTEEELTKQRELFVAKLEVMKNNFDLTHKNGSVS